MTKEEAISAFKEWIKRDEKMEYADRLENIEIYNRALQALEKEPCEDAISRKAVIKAVDAHTNEDGTLDDDITIILEDLPSVQPKSKTGHWIGNELGHCDNCGVEGCASDIWNNCKGDKYCPNCGAKIIDEEESK